MEEKQQDYGLAYRSLPPYEVLKTRWLSYQDILRLKGIEEMVETFYNSMQYTSILGYVVPAYPSPFEFYEALSAWYRANELHIRNHSRIEKYEILRHFLSHEAKIIRTKGGCYEWNQDIIDEMLLLDMYLRENIKKRPFWAPDQKEYRKTWRRIIRDQGEKIFLAAEDGEKFDSKKAENQSHIEKFSFDADLWIKEGILKEGEHHLLFDYSRRNPLTHNVLVRDILHKKE